MTARADHLEWCKMRAREYLDQGDAANAMASMMSDLTKHEDWRDMRLITQIMAVWMTDQSLENTRRLIEGFR